MFNNNVQSTSIKLINIYVESSLTSAKDVTHKGQAEE